VTPAPDSPEILRTKPVLVKFGEEAVSDVFEYEQPDGSHPISPGGEDLYGWTSPEEEAQNKANAEAGLLGEDEPDLTVQDVAEALQRGLRGELTSPEEEDLCLLEGRNMMGQLRGEGRMAEAAAVQDMLLAMDDLRAERGIQAAPASIDVVVPRSEDPLAEVRDETACNPNS